MSQKWDAAQTEEAEHKGFCDTELGTNKDMIQKLMQEATEEKTLAETNEDITKTQTEHKAIADLSEQLAEKKKTLAEMNEDLTETQAERTPFLFPGSRDQFWYVNELTAQVKNDGAATTRGACAA